MIEFQERGYGQCDSYAVCPDCILDEGLRETIEDALLESRCTFCGRTSSAEGEPVAANFELLMDGVMSAVNFFYCNSADTLLLEDDTTDRLDSFEVVETVCAGAVKDGVLDVVRDVINDVQWNEDPAVMRPDVALEHAWRHFEQQVQYQTRFVFSSLPERPSDHPDDFTINETLTAVADTIFDYETIRKVEKGHLFWRGRMISGPRSNLLTAKELGPPPPRKAAANRFSAQGISMFYGADDISTVVAEIGAHSSDSYAALAQFEVTKTLRMVDLAELGPLPSAFTETGRKNFHGLSFLHSFAKKVSAPTKGDSGKHIDYVPTQVVTEYLRWLHDEHFDGILFTSSQNGGLSCVIFCEIGNVEDVEREVPIVKGLRFVPGSDKLVRVVATPT